MHTVTKLRRWLATPLWERLGLGTPWSPWKVAAEVNGLTRIHQATFFWLTTRVEGWLDTLHVDMRVARGRRELSRVVQITVTGVARGISVDVEGVGSLIQKRLGLANDIETGEASFDDDFLIQGDPLLVHALMDADARAALRRVFATEDAPALAGGKLVVHFVEGNVSGPLAGALKRALDLARRLIEPDDVGARTARNVLNDPTAGVRRQCLLTLVAHYSDHVATPETLRRACVDASEDVRLEAALALQQDGHSVLRELAFSAQSESCAARAIAALGTELEAAEAVSLLESSLDRRRYRVAGACIDTLGRREPSSIAPGFEPLLVQRGLGHSDETVCIAAAAALGQMGTVAAVLPLQEAAQQAGGALRRALQDATRAIQSRLMGAERGQLTVSTAEGGTVTLASEGGQVSLPDSDHSRRE